MFLPQTQTFTSFQAFTAKSNRIHSLKYQRYKNLWQKHSSCFPKRTISFILKYIMKPHYPTIQNINKYLLIFLIL